MSWRGVNYEEAFLSRLRGTDEEFRAVALEIIGEEQQKNNNQLAKDLIRILDNGGQTSPFPKLLDDISSPLVTGNGRRS